MNFLVAILNALVSFVQRNPLTVLVILVLALAAPALLKGIAVFILYFILGLVVLGIVAMLVFRWKIISMRKQMEDQFNQGGFDARGGFGSPFAGQQPKDPDGREGDVKVYKTSETPEKRVSGKVGDYVDFEEEKDN